MSDAARELAAYAETLPPIEDQESAAFADRFADRKVVLLGEASHGTSEFYRARAAISRRLIERHGFTVVAVEADWPDASVIDSHVRLRPRQFSQAAPFARFPRWMWRNREAADFTAWLRSHNESRPMEERVRFAGLDLYSLNSSMRAVVDYLDSVDKDAARIARSRYGCLDPWAERPQVYGRYAANRGHTSCEEAVLSTLSDMLSRRIEEQGEGEGSFDAVQNARLVANAERYYRSIYHGAAESWNLRDTHMFETLEEILGERPAAKAIVWAHNSHIGDARATDMGRQRGELNIGQLCRERIRDVALIGFGTHTGTVAAADDWDEPMQIKRVNPSLPGSYEDLCHSTGISRFLLDFTRDPGLIELLAQERLERFIGVIYRPDTERWSHYAEAVLPLQFDAFVWFDETTAVTPLDEDSGSGADDTWPFGL